MRFQTFRNCIRRSPNGVRASCTFPYACAGGLASKTSLLCCRFDMSTCLYWLMRSFLLAEFAASLDWQLYFYLAEQNDWETNRTMALAMQILMLIVVYGMSMGIAAILDLRHLRNLEDTDMRIGSLNITMRELSTAVIIAITTFALSNLSYVSTATPFTSAIGTGMVQHPYAGGFRRSGVSVCLPYPALRAACHA